MAKKAARGRAKLAAKEAAAKAQGLEDAASTENRAGQVSAKTKKKVANKVQIFRMRELACAEVQESAASTATRKAKAAKRKARANRPLSDLAGLNEALQDLMPIVERQAKAKSKASANSSKFKRSGARSHLQLQAQEDIAAVLQAKEFKADPITALTTHLQLSMGPPTEPNPLSKPMSTREKKLKRRRAHADADIVMS